MAAVTDLASYASTGSGAVVTLGVFDGVHLGHQALLRRASEIATVSRLPALVLTFDPHPALVLHPASAPALLCDLEQRLELLAQPEIDRVVVLRFDKLRSEESPESFVENVLLDRLGARVIVVGQDFHFGHFRKGDLGLLKKMGTELGFDVEGVGPISDESGPISSTRIRGLLASGEVGEAAALLGRDYEIRGVVVRGARRGGAELGYPTANVSVAEGIQMPMEGIYAGWYLRPGGEKHPAAISLGRRPTFYGPDEPLLLEAHLMGFSGDLYGEMARVRLVKRLREEKRFSEVSQLVRQIGDDVRDARAALSSP